MFARIVAAIDNDEARAAKVIEATRELARAFGGMVLVAHVRQVERPAAMVGAARPGAPPLTLSLESEEVAQELVDAALAQLRAAGLKAEARIGHGLTDSTAREVLEMARAYGATLIVVGDRGSRVADVLLGGVANRIVHLADCPVLLVR